MWNQRFQETLRYRGPSVSFTQIFKYTEGRASNPTLFKGQLYTISGKEIILQEAKIHVKV